MISRVWPPFFTTPHKNKSASPVAAPTERQLFPVARGPRPTGRGRQRRSGGSSSGRRRHPERRRLGTRRSTHQRPRRRRQHRPLDRPKTFQSRNPPYFDQGSARRRWCGAWAERARKILQVRRLLGCTSELSIHVFPFFVAGFQ